MRRDTVIDPDLEPIEESAKEQYDHYERGEELPQEPEQPREPSKLKQLIVSVLSGSILSRAEVKKQYPYMLFIAFLMLLYISNIFKMQQLHRQHSRLGVEVKELRAKSLTISSQRVDATRQSQIIKELNERGVDLKESLTPPKVISK